MPIAETAE